MELNTESTDEVFLPPPIIDDSSSESRGVFEYPPSAQNQLVPILIRNPMSCGSTGQEVQKLLFYSKNKELCNQQKGNSK